MPHTILFTVFAVMLLTSCSSMNVRIDRYSQPRTAYFKVDSIQIYQFKEGSMHTGDSSKYVKVNRADSTLVYAGAFGVATFGRYRHFNKILIHDDSTWVDSDDMIFSEEREYLMSGGVVRLPVAQSDEAWGRAMKWVIDKSDVRVQTSSEYLIDTYNPVTQGSCGYLFTKRVQGGEVLIELAAKGGCNYMLSSAYTYIKYGR